MDETCKESFTNDTDWILSAESYQSTWNYLSSVYFEMCKIHKKKSRNMHTIYRTTQTNTHTQIINFTDGEKRALSLEKKERWV